MQVFLVLVGGRMIRLIVFRKKMDIKVVLEDKVIIEILPYYPVVGTTSS